MGLTPEIDYSLSVLQFSLIRYIPVYRNTPIEEVWSSGYGRDIRIVSLEAIKIASKAAWNSEIETWFPEIGTKL